MVRMSSQQGLKKKFVLALLVAGLLPGIVALFATYLYSKKILTESIGANFQEIASAVAKKVEIIINHDIEDAQTLALSPEIRKTLERENRSFGNKISSVEIDPEMTGLRSEKDRGVQFLFQNPAADYFRALERQRKGEIEYSNILVVDPKGGVVAALRNPEESNYSDDVWFQSGFHQGEGANFVSNLYYNEGRKDYFYDVVVPIFGTTEDRVIGVLKMEIRRDKLLKAILEVRVGKTGHAMLVSSLGNPLICPILPPTDHLINERLMTQISQPQSSWAVAEDDAHGGKDSIVGFAPITFKRPLDALSLDQNAWYAFIRQHPSESFAPVYSLLTKVGMLGFGLVFVISSLGYLVGRKIVKPILLLKERAQAIGQASYLLATQDVQNLNSYQFGERIEIKTGDEIQELAQAFNQMSLALEESLQTIKKQQKELVLKNELASIGQLLAALTHDLKNPLGIIRSSAQILNDKKESAKIKKEVGRYIIEEVDRLTFRINDFLRFARPRPPDAKPVHLEKIIERTLWHWAAQGDDHGRVKLEKDIPSSLPLVKVDPDHLLEALFNLLNNAREVMPEGGTITLRVRQNQEGWLEISIQDTGEGIATEDMGKIFDPFFTTKEYGIGLGLTNVKRLIEDNGGRIIVQSQKGQGTVFTLLFPPCPDPEGVEDDSSQVAHY